MTLIENFFNTVSPLWALISLIATIGLSVLFLRGIIRLAVRAFVIGAFGLIIIGALYYFL
jgi:hypothetical protein